MTIEGRINASFSSVRFLKIGKIEDDIQNTGVIPTLPWVYPPFILHSMAGEGADREGR